MLYAIIADIHSNLTAFIAVLEDIKRHGEIAKIWCLGDVVGYGPEPHECIKLLRQTDHVCVAGNHDWAAIGKIETGDFNADAEAACQWTSRQLTPSDTEYLENLPLVIEDGDFTLVHGSPREPIWEYLVSPSIAEKNLTYFKSTFCLVGHSHIPLIINCNENGICSVSQFSANIRLIPGKNRLIINPGGVGQPRDGDPQAAYAIYDSETRIVSLFRIPYDITATQDRMRMHGLPARLITRLSHGM